MHNELAILFQTMSLPELQTAGLIKWSCPILSFGNLSEAKLATIGLNPSNKEFIDNSGKELEGDNRRFHTLRSLGLQDWMDADTNHYDVILEYCFTYFHRNPYDSWFKKLDYIISGGEVSYYFPSFNACHLDLIPYATFSKWTALSPEIKNFLLDISSDFLGMFLNASKIEIIVLNGQTVVEEMENITGIEFRKTIKTDWTLPRKIGSGVFGYSYEGQIDQIGSIQLNRTISVLGYNHNIQSSFGVTKKVQNSIRDWITESITELQNETR